MSQKLTKEKANQLMKIKGEARGTHFKHDAEFILKEKGPVGLKKVEKKILEIGYPIEYKKINSFDFYPIGLRAISLLAAKDCFNWPDKKIEEFGIYAMKVSWIIKIFMKHVFSPEKLIKKSQEIWSKYFTVGQIKVEVFDVKNKQIVLKIEDFALDPIYCHCLKGVFSELVKMSVNSKQVICEEINCFFKNIKEKEHYFLIKWK